MILTCTYTRFSFIMFIGEAYTSEVSESESQSCPTLCDSMDYIVHGILQGRILEWVAFPFSRESSQLRYPTQVSHIAGRFFTSGATREALSRTVSNVHMCFF